MIRILKIVTGLIVGVTCGGVIGGTMLALPDLFDEGCGPLGCVKDWAILGFYIGSFLGGTAGAIIGLIVGLTSPIKRVGALIGAGIGSIATTTLFIMGAADDEVALTWAVLSIPAGALIGFFTAICVALFPARKVINDT